LKERIRINEHIWAPELRVISPDGENLGTMPLEKALGHARALKLDLIEIAPTANPPVAKITDYGKFRYEEKRKSRGPSHRSHIVETKGIQVKTGTGEHDLALKAKRVAEWLGEGHRVKIDLFLPGRTKYLDQRFLEDRLLRFLRLIPEEYKVAEPVKRGPKGLTVTVERSRK
jgi:translation initiation factor IF-3